MELYEILQTASKRNKKVIVILGDGIHPLLELHRMYVLKVEDITHLYSGRLKEIDRNNWVYYEHVRNLTRNSFPLASYFFIYFLSQIGLLQSVITTNYDVTLETMFTRLRRNLSVPVSFNPVLKPRERIGSGYCSHLPASPDAVRIWKIHGSLSHVICRKCQMLFPSPDFVLPFDPELITNRWAHPISHIYLPEYSCCKSLNGLTAVSGSQCSYYVHPIDWNFPDFLSQPLFKRVLIAGLNELSHHPFAIIILGFKGYLPADRNLWHEEINLALESVDGGDVKWAMYVSPSQANKITGPSADAYAHAHLSDIVIRNNGFVREITPANLALELMNNLHKSGLVTSSESQDLIFNTTRTLYCPGDLFGRLK